MCVNFSPSIYGNSSLETSCGLALSLSSVCDSRRMGQKYCPSIESCPLNTIFFSQFRMQWAACHCWGIIFSLCLHLCPCFWPEQCGGGDTYSSRLDTACTCLSSPAAFPPHQDCWVPAHFSWFCHHPWGSKFHFVYTSEEVCASAEWADNRCRLFPALVVALQFCVTFEPLLGGSI